jgi:hypothetical protein
MSLFGSNIFGDADLGQVTLPEPASDELIRELAITGGRAPTTSASDTPVKAGAGFRPTVATSTTGMSWAPYALVGGGVVIAGVLIWAAMRRPARATANRRNRRRRRSR